ncbi:alpha/beta hydrolase [Arenimonas sp.]|jgi:alpha/beta superfamily hydrolase|uniref:alpha/beta hydrolase n=1 Tax=Arenimonas sp. TaxID=1872635 RepID=UPI0037BF79A7
MAFPVANAEVLLPGPAGGLQTLVEFPQVHTETTPVAVICHPHPPDGGSMHNKVVSTLAKAFTEGGYIAVRFNFRGVGISGGGYDQGRGELADCRAVIDWVQAQRPQSPLALAGFSFGAWVALNAAAFYSPVQMVSIAPPVGFRDFSEIRHPRCPWLAVQGEADEIVPAAGVLEWLKAQTPPPEIVAMPETSHFFHGQLVPLREHVKHFLQALSL